VDVSSDQTSQNETPLAINPLNPQNLITGNNDWNYNDGCGVNTPALQRGPASRRRSPSTSRSTTRP